MNDDDVEYFEIVDEMNEEQTTIKEEEKKKENTKEYLQRLLRQYEQNKQKEYYEY